MTHEMQHNSKYKEVRGLSRGLDLLRALNGLPGGVATTSLLAKICQLDRTTTKRLLETLRISGYVRQTEKEGEYVLTFAVNRLSDGFHDDLWIKKAARPLMHLHVSQLLWPCDLGTLDSGFMIIRESTHRWSRLSQHRTMMGERLPLFTTAMGRAYLSACKEDEKEALLQLLAQRTDALGVIARDHDHVLKLIETTRERGYAVNDGEWFSQLKFSAIAVPVFVEQHLIGAMNMVFPVGSISADELKSKWAPKLQQLAQSVGHKSRSWIERP